MIIKIGSYGGRWPIKIIPAKQINNISMMLWPACVSWGISSSSHWLGLFKHVELNVLGS